jgi:MFS family permease
MPSGLFLSNLVILAVSAWMGTDFAAWGWRIPFFLSIVLIGIGLWIRLGILETPVFRQMVEMDRIERTPISSLRCSQARPGGRSRPGGLRGHLQGCVRDGLDAV